MNTTLPQIFVGIDSAKNFLDIYLHPIDKAFRINNNLKGIKKFIKILSEYNVGQAVFESSGGYERLVLQELTNNNYKVWQVEPKRIKGFIVGEGIKVKTDKIDAKMIALFAAQKQPKYKQVIASAEEKRLQGLSKRRIDLTKMIVKEKNRLQNPEMFECKEEIETTLLCLESHLEAVNVKISNLISNNSHWSNKAALIATVPGVGKITSQALVAEMPELGLIENKQAAALLGVAPLIQQSGTAKGMATIKGGRAALRSIIYMAAVVAIRCNPKLKAFYKRLREAGKKAKVALVAVMRKLITLLNVMVKKGEQWCSA